MFPEKRKFLWDSLIKMTNKKILVLVLLLSFLIFSSGCVKESNEICWEDFSKPSFDELDCLEIATESFSNVCNDVFNDRGWCFKLWENTEVSFDSENQKCFISIPRECEAK